MPDAFSSAHRETFSSRCFSATELCRRRTALLDHIGQAAIAVLQGAGPVYGFDIFRQTNEFFYLSGIEVPQAYLLLEGFSRKAVLFLPDRDPKAERGEGSILNALDAELAVAISGVDEVQPLQDLAKHLAGTRVVYVSQSPAEGIRMCRDTLRAAYGRIDADPWDGGISREKQFAAKLQSALPGVEIRDLTPAIDALRSVKSPAEIAVMRRAGQLSAMAVAEAMRSTRPGIVEHQLGAVADYLFLVHGARAGGYRPIIAGGSNAWFTHYYRNDCPLKDGDLVLMDYAPEVACYTSDIGRMWPVDGVYRPWQRELYGFMVEYHKTLLRLIRPGVDDKQILAEAAAEMESVLRTWKFSKRCYEEAARRTLQFAGHLSHPVGMSVHDPGDYHGKPLAPGTVFALDPQMWVPEEQLYIRVEDTVAVTDAGVEVLTLGAPLELDDVECLMREEGLLQKLPPIELQDAG